MAEEHSFISVDADECTLCGACVEECPYGAIELDEDKDTAVVNVMCNICGSCADVCPVDAICIKTEAGQAGRVNVTDYKGVWVFAEQRSGAIHEVTYELLGEGRKLADELGEPLCALLLGHQMEDAANELLHHGVDTVYYVDDPLFEHFQDDPVVAASALLCHQYKPAVFLAGATAIGRSFFPQVAVRLRTGLTADCTSLAIDDEGRYLRQTRPAFGGNIMATIKCLNHRPQMATVRHKVFKPAERNENGSGKVEKLPLPDKAKVCRTRFLKTIEEIEETVNLTDADIIVSGGRGLGCPENFKLIEDLAKAVGGAVGASRAAVDAGWIPYSHQVGQTGKTVCPKLYIAVGISGQIQHRIGMQSSDTIVAINKDPQSPIFDIATYGIVGDLFEIVPALTKRFAKNT